jgi:hypothetical protein
VIGDVLFGAILALSKKTITHSWVSIELASLFLLTAFEAAFHQNGI